MRAIKSALSLCLALSLTLSASVAFTEDENFPVPCVDKLGQLTASPKVKEVINDFFNRPSFLATLAGRIKLRNLPLLSQQERYVLAKKVWSDLVSQFKKGAPGVWSLGVDSNVDLIKIAKERNYSYEDFKKAALAIKEIDDNPKLKKDALDYFSQALEIYTPRALAEDLYSEGWPVLIVLGLGGGILGSFVTGVATNSGHAVGMFALSVVGLVPISIASLKGYTLFKSKKSKKALSLLTDGNEPKMISSDTLDKSPQTALLSENEPLTQELPSPVNVDAEITRLESQIPVLKTDSPSAIESYGSESEDALKLLAYEVSLVNRQAAQAQEGQSLKSAVEKITGDKTSTWSHVSLQLQQSLPSFQKFVRAQNFEFERIHGVVARLDSHFQQLIKNLENARAENSPTSSGLLNNAFQNRISELNSFRETLGQMSTLVSSEYDVVSKARQGVVSFNNTLGLRLSTSKDSPLNEADIQALRQLQTAAGFFQ